MQILPNRIDIKNLNGMKIGIVADPYLVEHHLRDIANKLTSKVIQAKAYCSSKGFLVYFVILRQESLPLARYIDAMEGIVVASKADQFVTFVVPPDQIEQVDAVIVFSNKDRDYQFEPHSDLDVEITDVNVNLSSPPTKIIKTQPYSVPIPKAHKEKNPYRQFFIPQDMFVVKMPDEYRKNKLEEKPDFPENYKLGDG